MTIQAMLSSKNMDWATPQKFFDELDKEFGFTLDPCATAQTAKCGKFYTPAEDGLAQCWGGETVFCNPPYGREIGRWVKKCATEAKKPGTVVVMLIPARTDTSYFHDYIYGRAELRFIRGRLKFTDEQGRSYAPAPFPSMVVVFDF